MINLKPFEKILKNIIKTGEVVFGYKESLSSVDESKLIICSSTVSGNNLELLKEKCTKNSIPFIITDRNSVSLSKSLAINHRISVFSILNADESDLNQILSKL